MRLLNQYTTEITVCTHCPRLCRFACPVAESEKSEAVTPTGLMSMVSLMQKGGFTGSSSELASALDHCTLCGRCTSACVHEQQPRDIVLHGRLELRRGLTPPGWQPEKVRALRAALSDQLARMQRQRNVQLIVGRGTMTRVRSAAFWELVTRMLGKPVMVLDPVVESIMDDLEQGYVEPYAALIPLVQDMLARAEAVYCFEDQTEFTLRTVLAQGGVSRLAVRSGWRLLRELVQQHPPEYPHDELEAQLVLSCGMRARPGDLADCIQILDSIGLSNCDTPSVESLPMLGCCGGGGYPLELQPDVARWSLDQIGSTRPLWIADRLDCGTRYAEQAGVQMETLADMVALAYGCVK